MIRLPEPPQNEQCINIVYNIWIKIRPKKQYLSEIRVGNDVVEGSETIRFLGITLDKELDMKKFIAAKARTAYFNI